MSQVDENDLYNSREEKITGSLNMLQNPSHRQLKNEEKTEVERGMEMGSEKEERKKRMTEDGGRGEQRRGTGGEAWSQTAGGIRSMCGGVCVGCAHRRFHTELSSQAQRDPYTEILQLQRARHIKEILLLQRDPHVTQRDPVITERSSHHSEFMLLQRDPHIIVSSCYYRKILTS